MSASRGRVLAYAISSEDLLQERSRAGDRRERFEFGNVLRLEEVSLSSLGLRDVLIRVLVVSAEHNVVHAAFCDPVDIVAAHGGRMYPGNSFLGEVIEVGDAVTQLSPGDIVIPSGTSTFDELGFPQKTWGFDDPLRGCYAEQIVLPESMLMRAPLGCGLTLWEIAVLPLRAANAYHLWRRGEELFRAKVPRSRLARANVLAFGGGVSELFLMLAHRQGHRALYCAGNARRRAHLEEMGIETIDQIAFRRFADPGDVNRFRRELRRRTDGVGVHIVCDMFRGPIFEAGLAVCARGAVSVSAGWQLEHRVSYDSAALSLRQITLDHAHVEMEHTGPAVASLFGEVFRPPMHDEIYAFADLPRAIQELCDGTQHGFAAIRVAGELPKQLQSLAEAAA